MHYPSQGLDQTLGGPKLTGEMQRGHYFVFRNIVKLKTEDTGLKIQWATAIGCKINNEDQPKQMEDTQILAVLEMVMPEKKNADTDIYMQAVRKKLKLGKKESSQGH